MSNQTQEPLWSDEAIVNTIEADAYYDGKKYGEGIWVLTSENSVEIARQIRDTYEQRLAAVVAGRDQLRRELNITKATLESAQNRLERVLDRNIENAIRVEELEQAGAWEPVPEGELGAGWWIENGTLWTHCSAGSGVNVRHGYTFLEDECLCRRTRPATAQEQAQAARE